MTDEGAGPRLALYWAPEPGHPLWQAGCSWLGRDPMQPMSPAELVRARLPYRHAPATYGFHATLKAPIRLAPGCSEADWWAAVDALAARHRPFDMPALQVDWLGRFLALRPVAPVARDHPLCRLADDAVQSLDGLRRPAGPAELARRQAVGLSPDQQAMLDRWGYPHVLGLWRFHCTLSDGFDDGQSEPALALRAAAVATFEAALARPMTARSLCVYRQPGPGEPFRLVRRLPLGGAAVAG